MDDFLNRVSELLAEEAAEPEQWFYLSFAGEDGFHGAVIVRGRGILSALLTAKSHGVDPGGEVFAVRIGADAGVPPKFWNRLLMKGELDEAFEQSGGVATLPKLEARYGGLNEHEA